MKKVGLGGSCHWCTEAIFQSLKGVVHVNQGWLSPAIEPDAFSEGVIVSYDENKITLDVLIEIHIHTHSSTSNHSLRHRYRSAVYTYDVEQTAAAQKKLCQLQQGMNKKLITAVCEFGDFSPSEERIQDYYYRDTNKPFCQIRILPKLEALLVNFSTQVDDDKKAVIRSALSSNKRPA